MKIYNHKIYRHLNGGNFASAKLATTYHALTKGRLSSFMKVVIVLFAFIQPLIFSSCSTGNDEEDNKPTINYKAELTAHEWEITQAANRLGDLAIDIKDADAYCWFSSNSVYFSTGKEVNYFDANNHITNKYEIPPYGSCSYTIGAEKIKIDNQTFMITNQDNGLVLRNEDWMLVLKNKQQQTNSNNTK